MGSRADWDTRYRAVQRRASEPDPFLLESKPFLQQLPAADPRVVDIACGAGRHALQLAQWGLETVAIDHSIEALRRCRERAIAAGVEVAAVCFDLESPDADLGLDRFDGIAVFYYLHRPLVPVLKRSLRPGGILVYKTYTRKQRQFGSGPRNPDYLLRTNELRTLFAEFQILVYREQCDHEATAALIARRPHLPRD